MHIDLLHAYTYTGHLTLCICNGIFSGPDPPARSCTVNGYHNVTSLNLKGSKEFCEKGSTRFDEVTSKCQTPETLQFIQNCDKEAKSGTIH